jgi:hypothetical protein
MPHPIRQQTKAQAIESMTARMHHLLVPVEAILHEIK